MRESVGQSGGCYLVWGVALVGRGDRNWGIGGSCDAHSGRHRRRVMDVSRFCRSSAGVRGRSWGSFHANRGETNLHLASKIELNLGLMMKSKAVPCLQATVGSIPCAPVALGVLHPKKRRASAAAGSFFPSGFFFLQEFSEG